MLQVHRIKNLLHTKYFPATESSFLMFWCADVLNVGYCGGLLQNNKPRLNKNMTLGSESSYKSVKLGVVMLWFWVNTLNSMLIISLNLLKLIDENLAFPRKIYHVVFPYFKMKTMASVICILSFILKF